MSNAPTVIQKNWSEVIIPSLNRLYSKSFLAFGLRRIILSKPLQMVVTLQSDCFGWFFFSLPQAVVGKRGKSNFPKCNTPVCSTCIWCPMARKSHCFCKGSAFLQEYAENHKVRQLIAYWFLLCRYLCGVEYLHCDLHERTIDENAIGECTWVFL